MKYNSEDTNNNNKFSDIKNYLMKKYKKTLLIVKRNDSLEENINNAIWSKIENLDDVISDIFKQSLFLKLFIVTVSGPVIFAMLEDDYATAKSKVQDMKDKNLFEDEIAMDVIELI
ncbi:hypothetical protein [Clostridium hydrogenum]|uniref:hypothetical protein n=1 Tax=Clostridium hydrogenum TaxID=2855764 RepID=UPI001F1A8CD7|nr:hypothetical protein [Clostridium hydrogenum]